jgi:DNA-binding winged helix-turn-helix (wHTH) protein
VFVSGDLMVDLTRRLVTVSEAEVQLTPTEYDILRAFVTHAGKVLTHHQILRQVWGAGYEHEAHMLRVNVSNLRRKIEPDPSRPTYILTEPGVGTASGLEPARITARAKQPAPIDRNRPPGAWPLWKSGDQAAAMPAAHLHLDDLRQTSIVRVT